MVNIDYKIVLIIITHLIVPIFIGRITYWLLPKFNGSKKIIVIILTLASIGIISSPIFAYLLIFEGVSEFISSVLLGTLCWMFAAAMLERRVIYALLNDPKEYEILFNPKESGFIRKKSELALRVKILSWYVLIFHYGGLISLFAIYVCIFFK